MGTTQQQLQVMQKSTIRSQQTGSATTAIMILLILIIGGMIGAGFYLHKQQQEKLGLLNQYIEKIEVELGAKNDAVIEFKGSLAKVAADTQSQDVILNDHLRTLEENLARVSVRLQKLEVSPNHDWLLSEVEYLMKMAEIRIAMKQDVKGAITILKSAETLIKKMPVEDKGLLNVRVAISKDIASMEMYRNVDVPGTYAELAAMGDLIEKLPLIPTEPPAAEPATTADGQPAPKVTQPKMLSEINEAFAGYLTIRKHDVADLRALLSPEERLNLRDSIRLALEQAQTGLLRGDQRIYDTSLAKVRKWLLNYFVADNFRVKMATTKIENLIKVQVEYDLPGIADSQQELKRYLADRMRAINY